ARRRNQVVRQRSAKPLFVGSIPTGASRHDNGLAGGVSQAFRAVAGPPEKLVAHDRGQGERIPTEALYTASRPKPYLRCPSSVALRIMWQLELTKRPAPPQTASQQLQSERR